MAPIGAWVNLYSSGGVRGHFGHNFQILASNVSYMLYAYFLKFQPMVVPGQVTRSGQARCSRQKYL